LKFKRIPGVLNQKTKSCGQRLTLRLGRREGREAVDTVTLIGEEVLAVVSGDGEGILQLREIGGVPFRGSAGRCGGGEPWEAGRTEAALGALC
jgi:hypothetical protein